jgi:transposase
MASRPDVKTRRAHLTRLWIGGVPIRLIAEEYGGTAQGVRSTIRKMRERGALPDRKQPQNGGMRRR